MMNRVLFIVPLIMFGLLMNGQYNTTPGTGVKWTLDSLDFYFPGATDKMGPGHYWIADSLTVSSTDTLVISQGLLVEIDSDAAVHVFGHLIVNGGPSVVTITASDSANPFVGFRFEEFSSGWFHNADISYGGGIRVLTEDFVMTNSTVSYQVAGASTGAAINFSRGNPVVKNSTLEHNEMPAFASGANQEVAPVIMDNILIGNTAGNSNRPQINLGPSGAGDTTKIIGNTIIGNRTMDKVGGISVSSLLSVPLNAIIDSNVIQHNRYGITMAGANINGLMRGNIIDSNNTQNIPMQGGSGISLNSTAGPLNVVASYNEISNNLWGITLIGKASINLGDTTTANYNEGKNIFSGNGNGGVTYALYNNTDLPVQAINNCWEEDTTAGLSAEDVIFHLNDDATLGEVFYNPVWDCKKSYVGLSEEEMVSVEMYPNPASEVLNVKLSKAGRLDIFDSKGVQVLSENLELGTHRLDINIPTGVYIVWISDGMTSHSKKLIIK